MSRGIGWGTKFVAALWLAGCVELLAPRPSERLLGTWIWEESTGGISGGTRTPASTGETMVIRFSDDATVEVFRNGEWVGSSGYVIADAADGSPLRVLYDEPVLGFDEQEAAFPDPSVLTLTDPCCDGFVFHFVRGSR